MKVFYIRNSTTVQDLQEIATTVRSVTEIRRSFVYSAQNAILVRGTADQVALAEKLIKDIDKPKAEVVVDVIVMEANRARVRDLYATITTAGGAPGINIPISYGKPVVQANPGTGTGTGTGTSGIRAPTNPVDLLRSTRLAVLHRVTSTPSCRAQSSKRFLPTARRE